MAMLYVTFYKEMLAIYIYSFAYFVFSILIVFFIIFFISLYIHLYRVPCIYILKMLCKWVWPDSGRYWKSMNKNGLCTFVYMTRIIWELLPYFLFIERLCQCRAKSIIFIRPLRHCVFTQWFCGIYIRRNRIYICIYYRNHYLWDGYFVIIVWVVIMNAAGVICNINEISHWLFSPRF